MPLSPEFPLHQVWSDFLVNIEDSPKYQANLCCPTPKISFGSQHQYLKNSVPESSIKLPSLKRGQNNNTLSFTPPPLIQCKKKKKKTSKKSHQKSTSSQSGQASTSNNTQNNVTSTSSSSASSGVSGSSDPSQPPLPPDDPNHNKNSSSSSEGSSQKPSSESNSNKPKKTTNNQTSKDLEQNKPQVPPPPSEDSFFYPSNNVDMNELGEDSDNSVDDEESHMIQPDLWPSSNLGFNELHEWAEKGKISLALSLKQEGNFFFKKGQYKLALVAYHQSISLLPVGRSELAQLYNNRGHCFLHLGQFKACVTTCDLALQLNPLYVKALLCRARAWLVLHRLTPALSDLAVVLSIHSSHIRAKKLYTLTVQDLQNSIQGCSFTDCAKCGSRCWRDIVHSLDDNQVDSNKHALHSVHPPFSTSEWNGTDRPDSFKYPTQPCPRCKASYYCSRSCFLRHWPQHCRICQVVVAPQYQDE